MKCIAELFWIAGGVAARWARVGVRLLLIVSVLVVAGCDTSGPSKPQPDPDPGPGVPPTVDAGADQTANEQTTVVLYGSVKAGTEAIASYEWRQTSGDAVDLSHPSDLVATFTAPVTTAPLNLDFEFKVTDVVGSSASDTTRVTVQPVNLPPIVFPGQDQTARVGDRVELNGLAVDLDGTVEDASWSQKSGPTVELVDEGFLKASFVVPTLAELPQSLIFTLTAVDNEGASASSDVAVSAVRPLFAGVRYSTYGPPYDPGGEYWARVARQMADKFPGARPQAIWIVSTLTDAGPTILSFPGTSTDPYITFTPDDKNEATLTLFDQLGVSTWLQVEPGEASVEELFRLILEQYGHHPCVVGVGVDVEWFHSSGVPGGRAVTDAEATAWLAAAQSHNPKYRLFLKHWETYMMPPTVRDGLFFISDSQEFSSLGEMMTDFKNWGVTFAPWPVGYQYGYEADKIWWGKMADPAKEIGDTILQNIPNTEGLYWVDFTALDVFPP